MTRSPSAHSLKSDVHTSMRTSTLLLPLLLLATPLRAQTQADISSTMFSDGVHPTLAVAFIGTDARTVNAFWKEELKGISIKVTDKKELVGVAARIPAISPDTLRIQVKADQPKGLNQVTVHVAIRSASGFIGPDSPERELTAARAYVEQRSVVLKRQLAQADLENGRKQLGRLQDELNMLQREKTRTEENITKTQRKETEAQAEVQSGEAELPISAGKVDVLREQAKQAPSDESDKQLRSAEREHAKLQDRVRRAGDAAVAAKKKAADLEWEVKKNGKDQEAKQVAIGKQEELVKELERNLANVK